MQLKFYCIIILFFLWLCFFIDSCSFFDYLMYEIHLCYKLLLYINWKFLFLCETVSFHHQGPESLSIFRWLTVDRNWWFYRISMAKNKTFTSSELELLKKPSNAHVAYADKVRIWKIIIIGYNAACNILVCAIFEAILHYLILWLWL